MRLCVTSQAEVQDVRLFNRPIKDTSREII